MQQKHSNSKYYNAICQLLHENDGVITYKQLKEHNIPTIYLTRIIRNGILTRKTKGIYILSNGHYDEYYFLSKNYNSLVFSHYSALYLNNIIDIFPHQIDVTVYSGYNAKGIKKYANVYYCDRNIHSIGLSEVKTIFGNKVKVYDFERTICDFVKLRKKTDSEIFSKLISTYTKYENKNFKKLYEYAYKLGIHKKILEIFELFYE
ncbi:Abortive infection protein AbiGI [Mycoplasmopsis agalactiae 14628]|uniref:Abortive infection protein AbiGI n=1 Tax=Mycoplasmopsis agalactiae 14628 TaxID=1110504 RepID=I5D629_MYCAA|nr:type IV toxin-antitoxin system AbiEi family antitoxin domain-containing protein [Mycoplasmopsis agalactiae]EIN15138.1 Abortive infection protein AbiGI [Mycoplasmopsis agalactiae 14628]